MIGQKLKLMSMKKLEIRNSYGLLPENLSDLAMLLKPETSYYQKKYLLCNNNSLKGLYPYTWCTSVKKFDETTFPTYEHFMNDLGGESHTMKYYKQAKNFYENRFYF